ncbi:hypothetical protein P3T24_006539 [Paraburkholderia sp. GAS33]|uniref:hypothetical protein n=1 Tax=Paraburkholderia sp. GAS33 TaxID=3035130 RepID=UPI003D1C6B3C
MDIFGNRIPRCQAPNEVSSFNRGLPRDYDDAVSLDVIDRRIRRLVDAFNVAGVASTLASCQGHGCPFFPLFAAWHTPYVMFRTNTRIAAELAMLVRADSLRREHLNYGWAVEGDFDDSGQVRFVLRCRSARFTRSALDRDFEVLRLWVQQLLKPRRERATVSICVKHAPRSVYLFSSRKLS